MMYRRLLTSITCAMLACACFTADALAAPHQPRISLKKQIETILADPDLARGFWGIEIASATTGKVLSSGNASELFTHGSDTKLFITAVALALICPECR